MADPRAPGFLGRVLDEHGHPAGTCFQLAPGVLVTACHVLADLGHRVVSGRYNSTDGWLGHSVWVARTEHLRHLLDGVAEVAMERPVTGAVELVFEVTATEVRLTGPGLDVAAPHGGVRPGLRRGRRAARPRQGGRRAP